MHSGPHVCVLLGQLYAKDEAVILDAGPQRPPTKATKRTAKATPKAIIKWLNGSASTFIGVFLATIVCSLVRLPKKSERERKKKKGGEEIETEKEKRKPSINQKEKKEQRSEGWGRCSPALPECGDEGRRADPRR